MTGWTLAEIEAELATKDKAIAHQACLLRVAPDLLAITQGQREKLRKAREDINWMLNSRQFLNPEVFDYLDEK